MPVLQCTKATTIPILKMRRLSSRGIKQQISSESSNWTKFYYSYAVFCNFSELDLRTSVGFGLEDPALRQKSNAGYTDTRSFSHSVFINLWLHLAHDSRRIPHTQKLQNTRAAYETGSGHRMILFKDEQDGAIQIGMNQDYRNLRKGKWHLFSHGT